MLTTNTIPVLYREPDQGYGELLPKVSTNFGKQMTVSYETMSMIYIGRSC